MRLIDADALHKKLLEEIHNRSMQGFGKGLMIAGSCVINAPTIEQRRTGRLINHRCDGGHHIADCDQCGHAMQWFDDDEPKFCCECGARVEGVEHE